jgi:hypothetical protein
MMKITLYTYYLLFLLLQSRTSDLDVVAEDTKVNPLQLFSTPGIQTKPWLELMVTSLTGTGDAGLSFFAGIDAEQASLKMYVVNLQT